MPGFVFVRLWRGVVAGWRDCPHPLRKAYAARRAIAAVLLALTSLSATAASCAWRDWEAFKRDTISADGRVIDASTPQQATVSEGQAYALFFALVANDRPAFDRLLRWTENNLADGDLAARLPAWIWGRRDAGASTSDSGKDATGAAQWGVIDSNPASDADLWIAYTLLEAGRLWQERRFTALGTVMARQILRTETAVLPGLGRTVLPGPVGFHPEPDLWRLNPSYVPPQVMRRLAAVVPALDPGQSEWPKLVDTSIRLLADTAPHGFAPDWVRYRGSRGTGRFLPDEQTQAGSAYNAIRVYLWIGMLHGDDPARQRLLRTYQPMADYTAAQGRPPERVDTRSGAIRSRYGNAGFSAAVAPYLAALGRDEAARAQVRRVRESAVSEPLGYYSQVLALFGLGYLDGLYRFEADGAVTPAWTATCPAAR